MRLARNGEGEEMTGKSPTGADGPATRRPRGRPRDPANDVAILTAARELLAEGGFDALTFEAVAQMTGISRVSIYRRWSDKSQLVSEIAHGSDQQLPDVIEGEGLEAEILAVLTMIDERYGQKDVAAAAIGMIVAWQRDPNLRASLASAQEEESRLRLRQMVDRGKALGRIRADVDSDALFDIAVGSIIYGRLFSSLPDHEVDIRAIADIIIRGAAPDAPPA